VEKNNVRIQEQVSRGPRRYDPGQRRRLLNSRLAWLRRLTAPAAVRWLDQLIDPLECERTEWARLCRPLVPAPPRFSWVVEEKELLEGFRSSPNKTCRGRPSRQSPSVTRIVAKRSYAHLGGPVSRHSLNLQEGEGSMTHLPKPLSDYFLFAGAQAAFTLPPASCFSYFVPLLAEPH